MVINLEFIILKLVMVGFTIAQFFKIINYMILEPKAVVLLGTQEMAMVS